MLKEIQFALMDGESKTKALVNSEKFKEYKVSTEFKQEAAAGFQLDECFPIVFAPDIDTVKYFANNSGVSLTAVCGEQKETVIDQFMEGGERDDLIEILVFLLNRGCKPGATATKLVELSDNFSCAVTLEEKREKDPAKQKRQEDLAVNFKKCVKLFKKQNEAAKLANLGFLKQGSTQRTPPNTPTQDNSSDQNRSVKKK